jgi:signal transduction histidine kinase
MHADGSLAVGLTALAEMQLGVYASCCDTGRVTLVGALLTLLETIPIACRRRYPVPVLFVTGSAATAQMLLGSPVTDFGLLAVVVAFYTVAAQSGRRLATTIAALTPPGIAAAVVLDRSTAPQQLMLICIEFAAAWALGVYERRRSRQVAERAARVERESRQRERDAAATERGRIARELHDVVAHSLSLISIQASAARSVMDTTPERARTCLLSIETVSREAWAEMRSLLDSEAESSRSSLEHLAELIQRFRDVGLSLDLAVSGAVRPLPAATDLCAFRVLQESLTNVLRHSEPVHARVSIRYGRSSVRLEIASWGRMPEGAPPIEGRHHGLSGMRERVRLVGGELTVEREAGRFSVQALLPIQAAQR